MAGDLQTLKEKGVFRRSWKFRELQVRDPKKSRNLIAVFGDMGNGIWEQRTTTVDSRSSRFAMS